MLLLECLFLWLMCWLIVKYEFLFKACIDDTSVCAAMCRFCTCAAYCCQQWHDRINSFELLIWREFVTFWRQHYCLCPLEKKWEGILSQFQKLIVTQSDMTFMLRFIFRSFWSGKMQTWKNYKRPFGNGADGSHLKGATWLAQSHIPITMKPVICYR